MKALSRAAAVAMAIGTLMVAPTARAEEPPANCHWDPVTQSQVCDVRVEHTAPPPKGDDPDPAGTGSRVCRDAGGANTPCHVVGLGDFVGQCYWMLMNPQPPYSPAIWEGHPEGKGAIYQPTACPNFPGSGPGVRWFGSPPGGGVTVTPLQLAQKALKTISLPKPGAHRSPNETLQDGRPFTVVRVPTWFWTDAVVYQPISARAAAGPVWAEVTVTPTALTFTPGDGSKAVTCAGPGRAWSTRDGNWGRAPGGCDYAYLRSSLGAQGGQGGQFTAVHGIRWTVTWTGSGGAAGSLVTLVSESSERFAVAEAQAVVTR